MSAIDWDIEVDLSSGNSTGEVIWTYPLTSGSDCDRYGTIQLDFLAGQRTEAHIEVEMKGNNLRGPNWHTDFHMSNGIENGYGMCLPFLIDQLGADG